jgi:hypothetical protein
MMSRLILDAALATPSLMITSLKEHHTLFTDIRLIVCLQSEIDPYKKERSLARQEL